MRTAPAWVVCCRCSLTVPTLSGPMSALARSLRSWCQWAKCRRSCSCSGLVVAEAFGQPALEEQEPAVLPGQDAAFHEQVAQVGGGPPVRHLLDRLVGEGDVAGGEVPQQRGDLRVVQLSWPTCCWIILGSRARLAVDLCVCVTVFVCDVESEGTGDPFGTGQSLPTWDCSPALVAGLCRTPRRIVPRARGRVGREVAPPR